MWVLVALASLIALMVLALSVPVELSFDFEASRKPRFRLQLGWLFGLVHREITRFGKQRVAAPAAKPKPGRGWREGLAILRIKGLFREVKRLLISMIKHFKIRRLEADFRVGLDDPAETGILFAFLGPTVGWLKWLLPQGKLHLSFAGETSFAGSSYGTVRVIPIQLAPPLMRFVFSPPGRQVLRKLMAQRWKEKK